MSLAVLVVDDEAPARERLGQLLADIDTVGEVSAVANGRDAIDYCKHHAVNCVLLDVRMPGMDGLETAMHLASLPDAPAIVFSTAYDQYALEAFETEAVGYLLKPVRRDRLKAALDKAARIAPRKMEQVAKRTDAERRFVCARRGDEVRLIPTRDVTYFEADQKYVRAWHTRGDDLIDDSLKTLEADLERDFVRIHRRLLVAVARIERVEKTRTGGTEVQLRGSGARLGVSRRHVSQLRTRLSNKTK